MATLLVAPALRAFLDLIAFSEGTSTSLITKNDGYDVIVSGVNGPAVFTDYTEHPFAHGGSVLVRTVPTVLRSTAAGRYQLLARYWSVYRHALDLKDFSPASQDAVALQQMKERGVTSIDDPAIAIEKCSAIWASFPGNSYGQGGHSLATLVVKYEALLNDASSKPNFLACPRPPA